MAETDDKKTYELAYYLSPNIAEAEISGYAEKIRKMISEAGGAISSETSLEQKKIGQKIKNFTFGYFGVMHFLIEPEKISDINRALKMDTSVLRAMITRKIERFQKPKKPKAKKTAPAAAPAAAPAPAKTAPKPAMPAPMPAPAVEMPAPKPELRPKPEIKIKPEKIEPEKEKIKMEELNKKLEEILGE